MRLAISLARRVREDATQSAEKPKAKAGGTGIYRAMRRAARYDPRHKLAII